MAIKICDSDIPKNVKKATGHLDDRKFGEIINGLSNKLMVVQHDRWYQDKYIVYSQVTDELSSFLSRHPDLRKGWR